MGTDALHSPLWGGSLSDHSGAKIEKRGGGPDTGYALIPPPRLTVSAVLQLFADPPHKGEGEARALVVEFV